MKYAVRHRLIVANPCVGVELPRNHNADGFAPVFLTATDVERLAAEPDAQAPSGLLVRFVAFTGLHAAEITGLRVRDVNLATGQIEVRQTLQRIGGEWRTGTPKSVRSSRNVPLMHRGLTADLRRLLLTHPETGNPDTLFWPGRTHGSHAVDWSRPLDTGSFLRNYMRPALDRVGLPRMRLNDLRHTYASLMLAAGFSAFEVSRFMGHASADTTTDIYGHLIPVDRAEQIDRFEAFVGA